MPARPRGCSFLAAGQKSRPSADVAVHRACAPRHMRCVWHGCRSANSARRHCVEPLEDRPARRAGCWSSWPASPPSTWWARKLGVHAARYTKLQELEWHFHAAIFSLWMGYCYTINAHPRVDSFLEGKSYRARAWIELCGLPAAGAALRHAGRLLTARTSSRGSTRSASGRTAPSG